MSDLKVSILFVAAVALFLFVLFNISKVISQDFIKECEAIGGKALYNGRHYDCLRPPAK